MLCRALERRATHSALCRGTPMTHQTLLDDIIAAHADLEGPLLPILHAVQAAYGYIDAQAEAHIAHALNLSRAEVHGVVSFYHDFTTQADPRPTMAICRAEACQARGVEALVAQIETMDSDHVHIKSVYCLGLCSVGPAARIGDQLYAHLDSTRLTQLEKSL